MQQIHNIWWSDKQYTWSKIYGWKITRDLKYGSTQNTDVKIYEIIFLSKIYWSKKFDNLDSFITALRTTEEKGNEIGVFLNKLIQA